MDFSEFRAIGQKTPISCPDLGTDLLGSSTTVAENILECGSSSYRLSDFGLASFVVCAEIGRR
jgi:hypothetical protein